MVNPVWSECVGMSHSSRQEIARQQKSAMSKDGLKEYDDEEWQNLLHWDDFASHEEWEHCIVQHPSYDWADNEMDTVCVSDYLTVLNKTIDVFGEQSVRWYQSEKFFSNDRQLIIEDIVTFLGLHPYHAIQHCFSSKGNFKKGVEEDLFAEHDINVVPMSSHLRSILVALHRGSVTRLERVLEHQFHWFDND